MGSISLGYTSLTEGPVMEYTSSLLIVAASPSKMNFHLIDVGFADGLTPLLLAFRRLMTLFTSL